VGTSGVLGTPIEIAANQTPLIFWKKELRPDTGAGRTRGGLSQIIEIRSGIERPWEILAAFDRIDHPARGHGGGKEEATGYTGLASGQKLRGKGLQQIPADDRLVLLTPAALASDCLKSAILVVLRAILWTI
jgi:N-methylhydantoinase B